MNLWGKPLLHVASLVACCLLVVSGCSNQSYPSDISPSDIAVAKVAPSGSESVVYPVSEPFAGLLKVRDDYSREIHDATELAIASCMKERGFVYTPQDWWPRGIMIPRIGDLEYARSYGFGIADDGEPSPVMTESDDIALMSESDKQAWRDALMGKIIDPASAVNDPNVIVISGADGRSFLRRDSCITIATGEIFGDAEEQNRIEFHLEDMSNEVLSDIESDPEFVETQRQWSLCVDDFGYVSPTKNALLEKYWDEFDSEVTSKAEIAAATATAQCEIDVGMEQVYGRLLAKYEQEVANANQGLITRFAELQNEAVARAKERLATK